MINGPLCQKLTSIPEHWYDRWYALDAELDDKVGAYQSLLIDLAAPDTFGALFEVLRRFGEGQFCHFYKGLDPNGPFLQESPREAPLDYVLAVTLDQISNDLHVIERAAIQHQVAHQQPAGSTALAFDTACRLAQHALEPVVDVEGAPPKLLEKMPIIIPYFQKSASIRIVPYADVVLLGLPLTAARVGRDYLVIPHEIGHYVYWRGRSNGQPVYRVYNAAISNSPDWARRWAEEIFADTYGSRVGGTVIALSSQDLANQQSLNGFTADDTEHPTPAVRPFIYREVLDKISQAPVNQVLANSSKDLKVGWNDRLGKRGDPILPITLEKTANRVYEVVDQALSILNPYVPQTRWSHDNVNILKPLPNDDVIDQSKVKDEYADFVSNIATLVPAGGFIPASLPDEAELPWIWEKWVRDREKFYDQIPPLPSPVLPGTEINLAHTPDNEWLYVLHAGGWTTEIGNHEGG